MLRAFRRFPHRRVAGFASVLVVLVVAAWGTAASTVSATNTIRGGSSSTLVIDDPSPPSTLDVQSDSCGETDYWGNNFYRQLFRLGRKPGPQPGVTVQDPTKILGDLVRSWTVSPDGRTYTFHLDPTAKFLDGSPITSQAVKFSHERALKLGACNSGIRNALRPKDAPTVSTPNAHTAVFHLRSPNPLLLAAYAVPGASAIFEPKVVQQHPDTPGQAVNPYWADHIAGGGGPYIMDQYVPDHLLVMHRNPGYTGPTPAQTRKVVVNFGQSESTLVLQARSGAADVTFGLTPDDLVSFENQKSVRIVKFPISEAYFVGLNDNIAPFSNVAFREALAYATPYRSILSSVLRGFGNLYYGPILQTLPHFNPALSAPLQENVARAKAALQQSGVQTPVDVPMIIRQDSPIDAEIATILKASWSQIGVNVTIQTLSASGYTTEVESLKAPSFVRLDGPFVAHPAWLLEYDMRCHEPYNLSNVCIPKADTLLNQAEATKSQATQQRDYDGITRLWRADYPKLIVAEVDEGILLGPRVTHYDWSVMAPSEVHGIALK